MWLVSEVDPNFHKCRIIACMLNVVQFGDAVFGELRCVFICLSDAVLAFLDFTSAGFAWFEVASLHRHVKTLLSCHVLATAPARTEPDTLTFLP